MSEANDSSAKIREEALWEVFTQSDDGSPHVHVGSVHAHDKEIALQNARDVYARRDLLASIWVVRASEIVASTPEDAGSFFDSAPDKIYRHPQFYKTPRSLGDNDTDGEDE